VDSHCVLAEPLGERVSARHQLPERLPGVVAFERDDDEVAHRGLLQERSLMKPGPPPGLANSC